MRNQELEKTYALAFKNCFTVRGEFDEATEILYLFCKQLFLVKESEVFFSPLFSRKEKKELLNSLIEKAFQNQRVKNFLYLLLDKYRFYAIKNIVIHLKQMQNEMNRVLKAYIETPIPLEEFRKKEIRSQLEGFFQQKVIIEENIKKHLLGGIRVKAKGYVFDNSVFFHLHSMEQHIRRSFYVQS